MPPKPPRINLTQLSHEDKDRLIDALFARLDAVEAKLGMNSENSSKPPSSDGLAKKTTSLRESSGKPVGGQKGRKGTTLRQADQPDDVVRHPLPGQCDRCHALLPVDDVQVWERRQVFDVPAVAFNVIEHQALAVTCSCGQFHTSSFPADVADAVQYGSQVRALGVHLTQGQMLPYARAAQLIADIYGLAISPGTLVAWVAEARVALQPTADDIARQLNAAHLVHADESGLRVAGKLHWLHIAANETHTWYGVHGKRGLAAIDEHGILAKRTGVLVHDCWAPYWRLEDSVHALCNAHLLRELLYVKESTGQAWPQKMSDLLLNANQLCTAARQQQIEFSADDVLAFRTVYDDIVREGELLNPDTSISGKGRVKQSVATNLLRRFRLHADAVLRFIDDLDVPFTNNTAERAVRMPKVKQKVRHEVAYRSCSHFSEGNRPCHRVNLRA